MVGHFLRKKEKSIRRYSSPDERISHDVDAVNLEKFLCREGGAIWRIFWLHIQHPDTFPIYDQHVHRAMAYLLGPPTPEEIPIANSAKVKCFILKLIDRFLNDLPALSCDWSIERS